MKLPIQGYADASDLAAQVEDLSLRVAALEKSSPQEPVRPVEPSLPEDEVAAEDVNKEIAKGGVVALPAANIIGTLIVGVGEVELVGDADGGTKIKPHKDQNAVSVTARHIESLALKNLHGMSSHRDMGRGIEFRLSAHPGQYAKHVLVSNCRMDDFDTSFEFVDDWARYQPIGTPGRLALDLFVGNKANKSYGPDSHSVGMYVEGLAEGCKIVGNVFDKSGWLEQEDRNKRSHCIYAQTFGAPIALCEGNVFNRAAANAGQFRAGCLEFCWNIINECSLGPWFEAKPVNVYDNVVLDQTDIQAPDSDPDTPDPDIRGHGFIFSGDGHRVARNILARQNGSQDRVPAIKGLWGVASENVVADWHIDGLNYQINGHLYGGIFTNRTLDSDPGIPRFTDLDRWIGRKPSEPIIGTKEFIESCWKAIA